MKISSEQIQQMLASQGLKSTGKVQKAAKSEPVQRTDDASLSTASQDITKALGLISKSGDVRSEKVAALRAQIQAGTYQVSGKEIAGAMLKGPSAEGVI